MTFFRDIQFARRKEFLYEATVTSVVSSYVVAETRENCSIRALFDKNQFNLKVDDIVLIAKKETNELFVLDVLPSGYVSKSGKVVEIYDLTNTEWSNTQVTVTPDSKVYLDSKYQSLSNCALPVEALGWVIVDASCLLDIVKTVRKDFGSFVWASSRILLDAAMNMEAGYVWLENAPMWLGTGFSAFSDFRFYLKAFQLVLDDFSTMLWTIPYTFEFFPVNLDTVKYTYNLWPVNFETILSSGLVLEDGMMNIEAYGFVFEYFYTYLGVVGTIYGDFPSYFMAFGPATEDFGVNLEAYTPLCSEVFFNKYGTELTTLVNNTECRVFLRPEFML